MLTVHQYLQPRPIDCSLIYYFPFSLSYYISPTYSTSPYLICLYFLFLCLTSPSFPHSFIQPLSSPLSRQSYQWLKEKIVSEDGRKQQAKLKELNHIAEKLGCTLPQLAVGKTSPSFSRYCGNSLKLGFENCSGLSDRDLFNARRDQIHIILHTMSVSACYLSHGFDFHRHADFSNRFVLSAASLCTHEMSELLGR